MPDQKQIPNTNTKVYLTSLELLLLVPVFVKDFFLSSAALFPLGTRFEGEVGAGVLLGPTVYVVSRLVGLS